ncbi:DUF29 domain-containing protein [Anabaena cylindrica FACHB-243]|uniref:DUF29 domain-containing protein n=1 Tax=Anabaena cylindrica (strain ATCC 27899 / PCC 7122) TaxID=272123 RepID=K9ZB92_ANACC|nr:MULTISPECIES: DUF29 domain-containing protein [Anabaena]AFZ56451.1 protein of unknown function DUF29 [Anabaena cylindrica PCC 7122]MBD2418099.1 DUF29 domain-containing protein [Anabaena cylindrica FACHB-243]MBY5281944.1 DUF29 domain-containing protein [Anabaena sp. CCAP 1446/1C]MBY5310842.1 DUF29 domain-containing protein [Anabaena sp. CCAP 1446/1C]MCM2407376.1 DUF29 domain-containing protein [Anabaena sp. CCAP 1446/1C]
MVSISKTAIRLYDTDFVTWTQQTAELIRAEKWDRVDWDAVVEEIESLGRSDRRELKSRLEVLLQHLLKWQYQPSLRSGSWQNAIAEQRNRIEDLLQDSPSLNPYLEEVLADCYRRGKKLASNETEIPQNTFPADLPYSVTQILDMEFLP